MEETKKIACAAFDFPERERYCDKTLGADINFDIVKRFYTVGDKRVLIYYVDGLVKDEALERVFGVLLQTETHPDYFASAAVFASHLISYSEVSVSNDLDDAFTQIHSGCVGIFSEAFDECIIVKARGFPQRSIEEPENDKVLRGPHVSFVETIVKNTALLRRHIKDNRMVMKAITVGSSSKTIVVLAYLEGKADAAVLKGLTEKLGAIQTDAIGMGVQSLSESVCRGHWYNPLPKFRYTERPDAAAASIMEGSVVMLCDNSPEAMIFPVSIFDFLQQTDDFYLPPLTASYLRIVRFLTCLCSVFLTPLWYYAVTHPDALPAALLFLIPTEEMRVPLLLQLILLELAIDGLKLASLNTPDMLSNSLSVIGGLILGDLAVQVGWFSSQSILYVAFVAIANFTQHNYELAYSFKYMRVLLLLLVALAGLWGFFAGIILILLALITNKTATGTRRYFYPLVPFNGKALLGLFIRLPKK